MSDFGDVRYVKTRKPHRCEWCGEGIDVGQENIPYYGGMWDGEFQSWYMHPECFEFYQNECDYDGFCPYENERPYTELK